MAKVVKNRLQVILREQQSDKRKAIHMSESLDKAIAEDEILPGDVLIDAESLRLQIISEFSIDMD